MLENLKLENPGNQNVYQIFFIFLNQQMMQQMGQQMQWNPQLAAQMNSAWQQHQQPPTSAAAHGQQKGQTASRPEVGPGGRPEVPGGPGVGQSGQALNQKTTPFQPPSGSTPGTTSSTTSLSREPDLNKGIFWQF